MRALFVLVLLVSCGGKSNPARGPDPAHAEREKELAEVTAFADRACACKDATCAAALDAEMKAGFEKASPWTYGEARVSDLTAEQDARVLEDVLRLIKCIQSHGVPVYALGVVSAERYEGIKDAACACKDTACVRETSLAWEEAHQTVGKFPADEETHERLTAIAGEATVCFQQGAKLLTEEAVLELKAIRKASCECEDAECATAARAELETWGVRHERTPADATTQEQLVEIVRQAALCQVAASSDAAQQAVADLTALRDAACACTTAKCADEVQVGFDAFLQTYADLHGGQESADRVGELASAMSACLAAARGESAP